MAYILCSFTRKAMDWASAHTNGAFGKHDVREDIEGPRTRERTNHLKPSPEDGTGTSETGSEVGATTSCCCPHACACWIGTSVCFARPMAIQTL